VAAGSGRDELGLGREKVKSAVKVPELGMETATPSVEAATDEEEVSGEEKPRSGGRDRI
jgi:hypothetical protein